MNHLIISYSQECAFNGHIDPNFTKLVYGDSLGQGGRGNVINEYIMPGSFIFFNTRIENTDYRYITAYYYVEKILRRCENDKEIEMLNCSASNDDIIVIGNRYFSKILTIPLLFNKTLIQKIPSFNATDEYFEEKEQNGRSELQAIADKTLHPHRIDDNEKEILLKECEKRG